MNELCRIGKVIRPHGIHGELQLKIIEEGIPAIAKAGILMLIPPQGGEGRRFAILKVRPHKHHLLVRLKGLMTREQAEIFRDWQVWIGKEVLPVTIRDFYFEDELVGLPCFLPRGERLGKVAGLVNEGAHAHLMVENSQGEVWYIPFFKAFVEVERDNRVVIHPIPGLLAQSHEN